MENPNTIKAKKIIWFVSSLEQKGGGERFVLESVNAINSQSNKAIIVCDRLNNNASFDGHYDLSKIISTKQEYDLNKKYIYRALSKFKGIISLGKIIKKEKPDLVICQSEFDNIKLYILSKLLKFNYTVFVFGQMFQFREDISKYSTIFRKNLNIIRNSRHGYKETTTISPPKLSTATWIANELISRLKYHALRNAKQVFTLSNQVKWEVSLLYSVNATVLRAAFDEDYIDTVKLSNSKKISHPIKLISISRLVSKKRIDIIINSLSILKIPAMLTIIGSGPEETALKELSANIKVSNKVNFLGSVDDKRLRSELMNADCFISMDIGDYDISVVEAMGKGLRVICATDFDDSDFKINFTGFKTVEPNSHALADAINTLEDMSPPSEINLRSLNKLTWQHLAKKCIEPLNYRD